MATVNRLNIWNATGPAVLYDLVADPNGTENRTDFDPETAGPVQKEIDAVPPRFAEVRSTALQCFPDERLEDVDPTVEKRFQEPGYIKW